MMFLQSIGLEVIFPIITTTVSFMFFLSVTEQYFRKRQTHQLIWAIAMLLFMVTAGAEALSYLLGFWDGMVYKIYYLFAAIQVTAMGGGVLYLFGNRNVIHKDNSWIALVIWGAVWVFFSYLWYVISKNPIFLWIFVPSVLIISIGIGNKIFNRISIDGTKFAHLFIAFSVYIFIFMIYQAIISPLNYAELATGGEVVGDGWLNSTDTFRADVRLFSPLFTIPGGLALIGGAFYSYYAWQRAIKKQTGSYELGKGFFNIYIGIGALALTAGGFFGGFGLSTLYISEVISVSLMYFGFLESDKITFDKLWSALTLGWLRKKQTVESTVQ
ncbi:MAG: hypothetical protein ACW981_14655 [Candidatus Hodarchaeales archaeon]|jgi:hypothetical protein